jgi:hypothetical protein
LFNFVTRALGSVNSADNLSGEWFMAASMYV